ncbi:MAG: LptF/LptG family permease, partial [Ferruginibacter sp.]|nr:LptF/LptG family permease [Chitinophagaceae bacterium]
LHLSEWHKKITMSIACLVLFLIGAPLGSIIRKGGLGTPLVLAVVFFVIFFLLNNFGLKLVKTDVLKPVTGMWLATFTLTPVGFFLIYKAMHDSQLFNQEFYFRHIRKFSTMIKEKRFGRKKTTLST